MKPTDQNLIIKDGHQLITTDNRYLVATCGSLAVPFQETFANAELIQKAWNVLRELNPTDPLAAAKALPGVVAALEAILDEVLLPYTVAQQAKAAIAALKGGTNVTR